MTELMKRYEVETGKKAYGMLIEYASEAYTKWLEAQLTWQPVSEKPKEGQIVFAMIPTGWVVAQYLDGGFYVDDGFTFGDFISGVSHWLPIPPMKENKDDDK